MVILFLVCAVALFVVVPFFAIKAAMKGDYPNRALVEKAVRERKAERESKKVGR